MKHINLSNIKEEQWSSPNGNYQLFRKAVSIGLGGIKDVGEWGGGHPFDVEFARLPSGKSNFPLHKHSAQTEMYIITTGKGLLHQSNSRTEIKEGDALYFAPGSEHKIENTGDLDLCYIIIADQPKSDVCSYPETGKLFIKPDRVCIRPESIDYFEPED